MSDISKINQTSGDELYALIERLYPICRSITGNGVRKTLSIIKEYIPVHINEVASGTKAYDWVVPKEWNIKDAYIKNSKGDRIVDFKQSNLHVMSYSVPVRKKLSLSELKKHLFTDQKKPDTIPYVTSYYKDNWGFSISYAQYKNLLEDDYEVLIDSELKEGSLTYGELYLKGKTEREVLMSTYICHPSLCNDNITGTAILTFLAQHLEKMDLKYSYRFLFIPETIGSICWLSLNEDKVHNIQHGLIATCLGDSGNMTYKKSKKGTEVIDKVIEKVLMDSGKPFKIMDFSPLGSDERQFSSPAFNLPFGVLMRTAFGEFPQYHTSDDNLQIMDPVALKDSLDRYIDVVYTLENDHVYVSLNPKCEPQLSKRGLYRIAGDEENQNDDIESFLWILTLCDGNNRLIDIAARSKRSFDEIYAKAEMLVRKGLLERKI